MKKFLVAATALSGFLALTGAAMAADPVVVDPGYGWFGSLTGAYIFEDPTNEWRLFGPDVIGPDGTSKSNIGDGVLARGVLGYRWSTWDIAAAVQYGDFGEGDASEGGGNSGKIDAEHFAVDLQLGWNGDMGNGDFRLAIGARYAEWDHDVDPGGGRKVQHDFDGIGPMAEFDSSMPISDSMTLELGLLASVLFGEIDTNASGGWICDDCSDENVTALNLEADIGIGFNLGNTARAVLGWQVQWWDDVNVKITDNTDQGGNEGKSGHLLHGPFVAVEF